MASLILKTFIILFIFPFSTFARQVSVSADSDTVGVGDEFRITVSVDKSAGLDGVIFPDSADFGRDFDVNHRQLHSGVHADSAVYDLRYFGGEDVLVPGLPVGLVSGNDTVWVSSSAVEMIFASLVDDETASFRPFKPLYQLPVSLLPYILIALILAAVAWYAYRLYRYRLQREPPPPEIPVQIPPFRDPLADLEHSLGSIRDEITVPAERFKEFYSLLGDAIRTYYEDLYKIPALESTTHELTGLLRKKSVDQKLRLISASLLNEADMVKFAKYRPDDEQCMDAWLKSEQFLNRARTIDGERVRRMRMRHEEAIRNLAEKQTGKQNLSNAAPAGSGVRI